MSLAHLSKKQFEAERGASVVVSGNQVIATGEHWIIGQFVDNDGKTHASGQYIPLTIPRRPKWEKGMTGLEIET